MIIVLLLKGDFLRNRILIVGVQSAMGTIVVDFFKNLKEPPERKNWTFLMNF